jgi:hypothetical protein
MACRVVETQSFGGVLFHQQEFSVVFNDCGHCGTGFPSCIHGELSGKSLSCYFFLGGAGQKRTLEGHRNSGKVASDLSSSLLLRMATRGSENL